MKLNWRTALIILFTHWVFVHGLWTLYRWFGRDLFHLRGSFGVVQVYPIFFLLFTLLLLILVLTGLKQSWSWIGFRKPSQGDLHDLWLLLAFVYPIPLIGRLVVPQFDAWYADRSGLLALGTLASFAILLGLTVIKEEVLERVMQRPLIHTYGPLYASLFLSMNFAALHFFRSPLAYGLASALSVLPVAFILAALYARTRNIWISLSFHLIFNFVVIGQIILHARKDVIGETISG